MKLFRVIPVHAVVVALLLVPAVSAAQAQQAEQTAKETAKKTRKKAEKTTNAEKQAGEAANTAVQTPETPTGKTKGARSGSAQRTMPTVSDSEIAAARASGKVWVNTETGVYHKGGRWYGATKQGKFMTEDDAIKAGYRASKSN
jgi:hypothetical protein